MSDTYSAHKRQAPAVAAVTRLAVLELSEGGAGPREIARQLSISIGSVSGYRFRAGLTSLKTVAAANPIRASLEIPGVEACHFISGETLATYVFCGAPAVPGKPYCAPHCAVCFLPPKPEAKWTEKRARACAVLGIVE